MTEKKDEAIAANRSTFLANSLCLDCGYSLRGLAENRCPECGRFFNPDDPLSVNGGLPYGTVSKWMLRPTRWLAPAATWIVAIYLLCVTVLSLPDSGALLFLGLLYALMATPYVAWSLIRRVIIVARQQPPIFERPDWFARRRIANRVFIAVLLVMTHIPGRLMFWVSRPWLDRYANHLYNEVPYFTPQPMPARFVGGCFSWGTRMEMNGVVTVIGLRAITYAPYGPLAERYSDTARIGGDWYVIQNEALRDYWNW